MSRYVALIFAIMTGMAAPLMAHHSFAAFDPAKKISITGTISKIEWTNPHVWVVVQVKDETGKITEWGIEGPAPNALARAGVTEKSLKIGEIVGVTGAGSKDPDTLHIGDATIKKENGKTVSLTVK